MTTPLAQIQTDLRVAAADVFGVARLHLLEAAAHIAAAQELAE